MQPAKGHTLAAAGRLVSPRAELARGPSGHAKKNVHIKGDGSGPRRRHCLPTFAWYSSQCVESQQSSERSLSPRLSRPMGESKLASFRLSVLFPSPRSVLPECC